MSRSHSDRARARSITLRAFANKRTGWYGEECWRQEGRKFLKRLVARAQRHYANAQVRKGEEL